MKRVALFAAHFPPSNLAGVHRSRLWAQHLEEFGWRPVIVTTHWRHYEEKLDWDLCKLLDPDLEIVRTPALPTKPIRLIGDLGVRGVAWHLSALRRMFSQEQIDFLHITIPSFYSALLGGLLFQSRPIPFGIDYIDPWVHVWPDADVLGSKAWVSMKLGERLEPWAVRNASLITGITEGYCLGVLQRNPQVQDHAVTAFMPYGNSARDFEFARRRAQAPYLFDPDDGAFHFVYAGAMLPKAYEPLNSLLAALAHLRIESSDTFSKLRIHFIGTGKSPDDSTGFNILPHARRYGVDQIVFETPNRIPYLDVLAHLTAASAILILGSTEAHYSPSKVYQSVQSKRPLFALLHQASTAIEVLNTTNAGVGIPLTESSLPHPPSLADRLRAFVFDTRYREDKVNWAQFERFSARESARKLATALDEASERFSARFSSIFN